MIGGQVVADANGPLLVWEIPYYPTYAFAVDGFEPSELERLRADGVARSLRFDGGEVEVGEVESGEVQGGGLGRYVALDWDAVDHWFEEDDEVFVHARSPYHRIDVLSSSRRVEVKVAGTVVADSSAPTLLFETGLPTRYYLPKVDVRMELMRESSTSTGCPYKGTARYWSVALPGDGGPEQHPDLAWGYDFPTREAAPIAGLVCFYNEHVDLTVDGEQPGRPDSPFSADKFA